MHAVAMAHKILFVNSNTSITNSIIAELIVKKTRKKFHKIYKIPISTNKIPPIKVEIFPIF